MPINEEKLDLEINNEEALEGIRNMAPAKEEKIALNDEVENEELLEDDEEINFDELDETASGSSGLAALALLPAQFLTPADLFKIALSSGATGASDDIVGVALKALSGSLSGNELIPFIQELVEGERAEVETDKTLTNNRNIDLYGVVEASSVVSVDEEGVLLGSTTAKINGSWAIETDSLSDGSHNFDIEVVSPKGTITHLAQEVTIDTTPPSADTTLDPEVSAPTKSGQPELTGKLSADYQTGDSVQVEVAGRLYTGTINVEEGTWNVEKGAITYLGDGSYNVVLHITDQAGNRTSLLIQDGLNIDHQSPESTVKADIDSDDETPIFEGTAEAGSTILIKEAGKIFGETTADAEGNWKIELNIVDDGSHNFSIVTTDEAGNESVAEKNIVVDTTPPEFNSNTINMNQSNDGSSIAPSGDAEANSEVELVLVDSNGNKIQVTAMTNSIGEWSFDKIDMSEFADGNVEVTFSMEDLNGNRVSNSESLNFIKDTVSADVDISFSPITSDSSSPTISGTITSNEVLKYLKIEINGQTITGVNVESNGSWKLHSGDISFKEEGIYTLNITAIDMADNKSDTFVISNAITIDKSTIILDADDKSKFGSSGDDTIIGNSENNELYGKDGDDYIVGGKGEDYLLGGEGNDTLVFDENDKNISGGNGLDTLLVFNETVLSFDKIVDSIEILEMRGSLEQHVTLTLEDVLKMTDKDQELLVHSDDKIDDVILVGEWQHDGAVVKGDNNHIYDVYHNSDATIKIDHHLAVFDDHGNAI